MKKIENKSLNTKVLGKTFFFYETIDSTQKEIWRRIKNNNIENGTIIMADIQTSGIGTHGRTWHTDKKNNIAFSVFLNVNCKIEKIEEITIKIAEILIKSIQELYDVNLKIKYPNDIMLNNKKVAGILVETKIHAGIVKKIVIGIGINTNQTEFLEDISDIATSLKNEVKTDIQNDKIIVRFCELFEKWLNEKGILI